MTITVNNLSDFETMITTCVFNGEKNVRLFASNEPCPGHIAYTEECTHIRFSYVFLSPLYQCVYHDVLSPSEHDFICKGLLDFCDKIELRVQMFRHISVSDAGNITLSDEIGIC